jgi:hypothetical protein
LPFPAFFFLLFSLSSCFSCSFPIKKSTTKDRHTKGECIYALGIAGKKKSDPLCGTRVKKLTPYPLNPKKRRGRKKQKKEGERITKNKLGSHRANSSGQWL